MHETAKPPISKEQKSLKTAEHWAPFADLRQEIDRLFDDFSSAAWPFPTGRFRAGMPVRSPHPTSWQIVPAMDLVEKDGAYEISVELPGIDAKNVEIKLSNGTLSIKGEKSEEKEEKDKEYVLSERSYGSFQRSFRLPDGIDTDKIEASFAKGVLKVVLPKSVEARRGEKSIAVKVA